MRKRSLLPDAVEAYLYSINREGEVAQCLREETALLPEAGMQIGPDQAALIALLVRATGARRALEIGTFTGYSALAIAGALPLNGKLVTLDRNEAWTAIARRYWRDAGLESRIELRLGDATATLAALQAEPGAPFEFAFIDADKTAIDGYYEACLKLVRPGGLIAIDNVLWSGAVADPRRTDADTAALRALNLKIRDDPRVDAALVGVGDGLTLAWRRA